MEHIQHPSPVSKFAMFVINSISNLFTSDDDFISASAKEMLSDPEEKKELINKLEELKTNHSKSIKVGKNDIEIYAMQ